MKPLQCFDIKLTPIKLSEHFEQMLAPIIEKMRCQASARIWWAYVEFLDERMKPKATSKK